MFLSRATALIAGGPATKMEIFGVGLYLSHPLCETLRMITRRHFLLLAPLAGLFGLAEGWAKTAVKPVAKLRQAPDDSDWDLWKNLPRTPLARSEAPMADALCHAAAWRRDVTILYEGGSMPGGGRTISPLGVFMVTGYEGTYVHALCHQRDAERTFRVERITAIV